jgi:hypothetical protein
LTVADALFLPNVLCTLSTWSDCSPLVDGVLRA